MLENLLDRELMEREGIQSENLLDLHQSGQRMGTESFHKLGILTEKMSLGIMSLEVMYVRLTRVPW